MKAIAVQILTEYLFKKTFTRKLFSQVKFPLLISIKKLMDPRASNWLAQRRYLLAHHTKTERYHRFGRRHGKRISSI